MTQETLPLTRESQSQKILAALQNGERLTPMDALERFRCFRLSGRVKDLRDSGHNVKSQMITVGVHNTKRVAQYWIDPSEPLIPRTEKKKEKSITISELRSLALQESHSLEEQMLFSRLVIAAEKISR